MALREEPEPYGKHVYRTPILQNAFTNHFTAVARKPYGEHCRPTSILTGRSARDVPIVDQYQRNVFVSNDTVERLIDANRPAYIGGAVYLEPIRLAKNPLNRYSSIGC